MKKSNHSGGFTLTELLVVIGILTLLAAASAPVYGNLQNSSDLEEAHIQVVQLLRQARAYSVAGKHGSSFGVYFDNAAPGNARAVLYRGDAYLSRDSGQDRVLPLSGSLDMRGALAENDINFSKYSGSPNATGSIEFANAGKIKTIEINTVGTVDYN